MVSLVGATRSNALKTAVLSPVEPEVVLFVYMDANREFLRAQRIRVTSDGMEPLPW